MPDQSRQGRATLGVDHQRWDRLTRSHGLNTEAAQARRIGVSRQHLSRVRNGHCAPGAEFIAGVLQAFPEIDVRDLFPIITPKDSE